MGKLDPREVTRLMEEMPRYDRIAPHDDAFTMEEGAREAARCLHCDCRKLQACKLRDYALDYGAQASKYSGERREFTVERSHPEVIYEPGKCIDCGICIQIAEEAREPLGLSFIARGFAVRVAVPFNERLRRRPAQSRPRVHRRLPDRGAW